MYYKNSPPPPAFHLPQNYSGCVFSTQNGSTTSQKNEEIEKKSCSATPDAHLPADNPFLKDQPPQLHSSPLSLGKIGLPTEWFSHMKSDDLLLLGLILLLARSDSEESDMIPWLALLLFCG